MNDRSGMLMSDLSMIHYQIRVHRAKGTSPIINDLQIIGDILSTKISQTYFNSEMNLQPFNSRSDLIKSFLTSDCETELIRARTKQERKNDCVEI